jgi:hypothetical protein
MKPSKNVHLALRKTWWAIPWRHLQNIKFFTWMHACIHPSTNGQVYDEDGGWMRQITRSNSVYIAHKIFPNKVNRWKFPVLIHGGLREMQPDSISDDSVWTYGDSVEMRICKGYWSGRMDHSRLTARPGLYKERFRTDKILDPWHNCVSVFMFSTIRLNSAYTSETILPLSSNLHLF